MVSARGFSLIELVIVIALIGVLAAGILIIIDPAVQFQRARDGTRKSDLKTIQSALELFRTDNHCYPSSSCAALTSFPPCGSPLAVGSSTYIQKVPCDPKNTGQYVYTYTSDGTTYTLVACLERTNDLQKDTANNVTYCTGGTTNWSYTVQSL